MNEEGQKVYTKFLGETSNNTKKRICIVFWQRRRKWARMEWGPLEGANSVFTTWRERRAPMLCSSSSFLPNRTHLVKKVRGKAYREAPESSNGIKISGPELRSWFSNMKVQKIHLVFVNHADYPGTTPRGCKSEGPGGVSGTVIEAGRIGVGKSPTILLLKESLTWGTCTAHRNAGRKYLSCYSHLSFPLAEK